MASVEYDYECDRTAGVLPDPNEHKRFGYITSLKGFGPSATVELKRDLACACAYSGATPTYNDIAIAGGDRSSLGRVQVVAVLEKFHWGGGVNHPLAFGIYMSQENALALKAAQQSTLTSTRIDELGFWIGNYDQELKVWYEEVYPASVPRITGVVGLKENPGLHVDLSGVRAATGSDALLYRVTLNVAPAGNEAFTLFFASSSKKRQVKSWGLQVGT